MVGIQTGTRERAGPSNGVMAVAHSLVDALEAEGMALEGSYLYGSHAAGQAHDDSDIDVAVVSPDLTGSRLEDWCTLGAIASRIDARLEVLGFRPEQFQDEHPVAWEIKTKGIKLG